MSFADYLRLRNYLDRPGETVLAEGDDTVTHAFNREDDRGDLMRRANAVAVVLGLHDLCGACGGVGGANLPGVSAECAYCNGTGIRSAGSFTPAIDRLALEDIDPVWTPGQITVALQVTECPTCDGHLGWQGPIPSEKAALPCPDCAGTGFVYEHQWHRPRSLAQGEPCPCNTTVTVSHPGGAGAQWLERHSHCPWCVAITDTNTGRTGLIAHGLGLWGWRDSEDGPGWDYPFGVIPSAEESADDDEMWQELFVVEVGWLYNRQRLDVAWAAAVYADVVQVVTERVALAREAVERADMGPWNHAAAVADPISPATV